MSPPGCRSCEAGRRACSMVGACVRACVDTSMFPAPLRCWALAEARRASRWLLSLVKGRFPWQARPREADAASGRALLCPHAHRSGDAVRVALRGRAVAKYLGKSLPLIMGEVAGSPVQRDVPERVTWPRGQGDRWPCPLHPGPGVGEGTLCSLMATDLPSRPRGRPGRAPGAIPPCLGVAYHSASLSDPPSRFPIERRLHLSCNRTAKCWLSVGCGPMPGFGPALPARVCPLDEGPATQG